MQHSDKYLQHHSIISPVWLNGWFFAYKLSGCGLESHCTLEYAWINRVEVLNMTGFSICEYFKTFWIWQNMPWQSSKYILGSKNVGSLSEYGGVLNTSHTTLSARSLYKSISTYWEMAVFRTLSVSI